jgi:hypothetical protein
LNCHLRRNTLLFHFLDCIVRVVTTPCCAQCACSNVPIIYLQYSVRVQTNLRMCKNSRMECAIYTVCDIFPVEDIICIHGTRVQTDYTLYLQYYLHDVQNRCTKNSRIECAIYMCAVFFPSTIGICIHVTMYRRTIRFLSAILLAQCAKKRHGRIRILCIVLCRRLYRDLIIYTVVDKPSILATPAARLAY